MEDKSLEDIRHIRQMMERSTRFISLSGMSGVIAGTAALLGSMAQYLYMSHRWTYRYYLGIDTKFITFTILNFSLVLIISLSAAWYFTSRKAKKNQQALWDGSTRRLLINLGIPLITGGIWCLILLLKGNPELVAPSTLIFYGLALINGSNFTLRDIRSLGILEIALGLVASFYLYHGLLFWAIGFGVFHIGYGTFMYFKYDRN